MSKLILLLSLTIALASSASGWTREFEFGDEARETLLENTNETYSLYVSVYDNGLVDMAISSDRGETLFFSNESTSYRCIVSVEPFELENSTGVMIFINLSSGGNRQPYESYCVFIDGIDFNIYNSILPSECHNMGGPGPWYDEMLDTDGNGYYDHFSIPSALFYLPSECQALNRQLWINQAEIPIIDENEKLRLIDNTLIMLTTPAAQSFRDSWIRALGTWLDESAELSQTHESLLEARSKVWALKEALSSDNYDQVTEVYQNF